MQSATVLGAGVIGLTTAHALQEAGFDVRVVAAAKGPAITSAAAGAIWFPFRADPPHQVNRWAAVTRTWQESVAREHPSAGIDILDVLVYTDTDARPWWAEAVRDLQPPRRGDGSTPFVWQFRAPRIEPYAFCTFLERGLRHPVQNRAIGSFDELDGDLIVNCTGLGARKLTGDTQLQGIFGQTVIAGTAGLDLTKSISDDRDPDRFFYYIPRRHEVVLGGVAIAVQDDSPGPPTPALREQILQRAREHGLKVSNVLRDSTGLRPYRPTVRLERGSEPRIVHNYGHGGSGFTLCRGCALDVVALCR